LNKQTPNTTAYFPYSFRVPSEKDIFFCLHEKGLFETFKLCVCGEQTNVRPVQLLEYWSIDVNTHTFWLILICLYVDGLLNMSPSHIYNMNGLHSIAFHKSSSTDNKFHYFFGNQILFEH